jgi:hypothetical protein
MISSFLLLAAAQNTTWYVLPLAGAISLVYSASRYELFLTITGFMAGVFVILWLLSANL